MAPFLEEMITNAAHPAVPFLAVALYWAFSKAVCDYIRKEFSLKPKGTVIQSLTIAHSLLLALYSAWTCYSCVAIVLPRVWEHGFWTLCDTEGELWHGTRLGFLVNLFYLSKYYEFIDTWIVMLKGREPIFLQTFHHAGIVVFMWALCVTEATAGGTTTTIFNSFIHTLMYTYYALAAFGVPCPFKQYLTMAQIVQFLIGVPIIVPTYLSSECTTLPQKLVTIGMQVYVSTLIVLFYRFYQSSYKSKGSDKNL